MGFGDVKLFAAIGILTGFPGTIYTIFISIIIASLGFIVTIIVQKITSKIVTSLCLKKLMKITI